MDYEVVIGLEVHAQLLTDSKIFCSCNTKFGAEPNTQGCPVCLGMPGVLPVLNKKAVKYALKMAIATDCRINPEARFARKNYFYPDLPKGYQISQYEEPLAIDGFVEIDVDGKRKRIGLIRIHLEEDAGKLVHHEEYVSKDESFFDVNRCGVPLIEIVSKPDMRSPDEAALYLNKLRQILLYLDICDGNMEEGSLRFDANISIRPTGSTVLGTKTEIKNMNSFRNVQRALEVETKRQIELVENGEKIMQQTFLWDVERNMVFPMRSKEEAHDYRYFPEPDLVPVAVDEVWIQGLKVQLPELPNARKDRFIIQYGLPPYDAEVLTVTKQLADYYEECLSFSIDPKMVSNWIMSEVLRELKDRKIELSRFHVRPKQLAELLELIKDGTISGKIAKTVFEEMAETGLDAKSIVEKKGLIQITDQSAIEKIVEDAIRANPTQVEQYRAGKTKVIGFFVGEVMKATKGKANPQIVNKILLEKL